MNIQCSGQQPSEASPRYVHLLPIDSCMNAQCSGQQPSEASPRYVHLLPIDSCKNIQCSNEFFSGAFGGTCSKFFPAPSALNVQNFLRRLRRKVFNVSLAPSEQNVKNSLVPSAQNIQNFLQRFRCKKFFLFIAILFSPCFARKRFKNLSALRAKSQSRLKKQVRVFRNWVISF